MYSERLQRAIEAIEARTNARLTAADVVAIAKTIDDGAENAAFQITKTYQPGAKLLPLKKSPAYVTIACDPAETAEAYVFGLVADGIKGLSPEDRMRLKDGAELVIEFDGHGAALAAHGELHYIQQASDGIIKTLLVRSADGKDLAPPIRKAEIMEKAERIRKASRFEKVTRYASEVGRRFAAIGMTKVARSGTR